MRKVTVVVPTIKKNEAYRMLAVSSLSINTTTFKPVFMIMENGPGTDEPAGQCTAVNKALPYIETEWMMVINDDMYFPTGWDRNIEWSHDCFCPNWIEPVEVGSAPPFLKFDGGDSIESLKEAEVIAFSMMNDDTRIENGFNLGFFIKTDLFRKIGGYDEAYDPYG
jgi:hypothetical protein